MSTKLEAFQALLARMREEFLAELPERCGNFEEGVLALKDSPADRETFNSLYRGVHSLKGSGGTHGLGIITTICHQLENLLTESDAKQRFDETFVNRALAYVDLLRSIETLARDGNLDFSAVESKLDKLRLSSLQRRKAGLIAESSSVMVGLYQNSLSALPLQLSVAPDGLSALTRLLHEPFDFVIVGRELRELNGIALITALRVAHARNHAIPAILVSSKHDGAPDNAGFSATIARDQMLASNLLAAVQTILPP